MNKAIKLSLVLYFDLTRVDIAGLSGISVQRLPFSYAIFGIWFTFGTAHSSAFDDILDADTFPSAEST